MRVLVIGGRGYYGARVVEVLQRLDGLRVVAGGRHTIDGRIDLLDPATFPIVEGFGLVVNCSATWLALAQITAIADRGTPSERSWRVAEVDPIEERPASAQGMNA